MKTIKFLICAVFLLFSNGNAGENTVEAGKWRFTYDTGNGFWKELKWDGEIISANPDNMPPFTWGPEWPTGKPKIIPESYRYISALTPEKYLKIPQQRYPVVLKEHIWDASQAVLHLKYEIGKYDVEEILTFGTGSDPDLFTRTLELTLRPGAASNFFFSWPQLNLPIPVSGRYFFPGMLRYPANVTVKKIAGLKPGTFESGGYSILPLLLEQNGFCSILFGDPLKDKSSMMIVREGKNAAVQYHFKSYGLLYPGEKQIIGPAYLKPARKSLRTQMKQGIHELYRETGITIPKDRPEWLYDAIIFNLSPGGSPYSGGRDIGGFEAVRKEILPRIQSLGFNTVWFRPIVELSDYHPRDYYKLNPAYGTLQEYQHLAQAVHDAGMKIMLGIVPHGTNAVSGMVRGNSPESLIVNKDGAVPRYMAFDYMSPKWQEYLKKVAAFFGSEFQADALRIDLADGSYPNWRTRDDTFVPANVPEQWWRDAQKKGGGKLPPLPYMRASLSRRQGGLEISRAIREGLRSVKPDGAVLGEVQYAPYMTTNDIVYDKELGHFFLRGVPWCNSLAKDSKVNWVQSLSHRLEQQEYVEPENTLRLRFTETHDYTQTRQIVGINAARAATALNFVLDGIPMVLQDFDEGNGVFLRRLIAARKGLIELRRGRTLYLNDQVTPGDVFGCVRTLGDRSTLCLINFSADPRRVKVTLPRELNEKKGVFHDAFSGQKIPVKRTMNLQMAPYEAKILALRPEADSLAFCVPAPERKSKLPPAGTVKFSRNQWGSPIVSTGRYTLSLSSKTGMLTAFSDHAGNMLLEDSRFLGLESFLSRSDNPPVASWSNSGRKTEFGWELPGTVSLADGSRVSLLWKFYPDHVELETALLDDSGNAENLALAFSRRGVKQYQVNTAEGLLDDEFRTRFDSGTPGNSNRHSYRFYGTPIVWQSELQPLDFRRPYLGAFADSGVLVGLKTPWKGQPVNAMMLDRIAGKPRWCAAFFYRDSQAGEPVGKFMAQQKFTITLTPAADRLVSAADNPLVRLGEIGIRNLSYGWLVKSPGYEVEISRVGGAILRWSSGGQRILSGGTLISQNGAYAQEHDYESAVRIWQDGSTLKMLFNGVLKDTSMTHTAKKMQEPYLRYYTLYTFGKSAAIQVDCGFQSAGKRGEKLLTAGWKAGIEKTPFRLTPLAGTIKAGTAVRKSRIWNFQDLSAATLSDGKWHHLSFKLEPVNK